MSRPCSPSCAVACPRRARLRGSSWAAARSRATRSPRSGRARQGGARRPEHQGQRPPGPELQGRVRAGLRPRPP
eukprot:4365393-Alexandrium_andersonii.AAC.1